MDSPTWKKCVNFNYMKPRHFNYFCWTISLLIAGCYATPEKEAGNTLKISPDGFEFQLYQRRSIELPSRQGGVLCNIDDITRGQVQLTITENNATVLACSIREGESVPFSFHGASYRVSCEEMVNKLIGDDYAFFRITRGQKAPVNSSAGSGDESKRIESFIQTIEASDVQFIRNGQHYSGREAAAHLRKKWEHQKEAITTLDDFIRRIATKSSVSGEPYRVELTDGTTIDAQEWYQTIISGI